MTVHVAIFNLIQGHFTTEIILKQLFTDVEVNCLHFELLYFVKITIAAPS